MSTDHRAQLARIKRFDQLIAYLRDEMGWPIDRIEIDDLMFDYAAEELGIDPKNAAKIEEIKRLRPLSTRQPWGIFFVRFAEKRLAVSELRRILRAFVRQRRATPSSDEHKQWSAEELLFICLHKEHSSEAITFVHFEQPHAGHAIPRLTSFGWSEDSGNRTVLEFNLPALRWPQEACSPEEWRAQWFTAFDVEKVTRRFYEEYASAFGQAERSIAAVAGLNPEELRLFTQSLFNRLMFLRFIERKGWLHFPGQIGTRYLAALATAGGIHRQSFFAARLCPLFFEGLAEEGKQESTAYGRVPLLNGGLFERSALDREVTDIPDEVFSAIIGADGLFYRYNFTVEESTPLDIEVAVDPEMLGKVFEELVTGRQSTGSYYTPRPVVAYMCREVLKEHLARHTTAPAIAVSQLVDNHVVNGLSEAHAAEITSALASLRAMDPACGSGAYLLGLLQELIAVRRALQSQNLTLDARFLYDLKLHIITHNLSGVDIDPFATEIAKLRLWLSLAVEATKPLPLPNLDYQIETGDSLLGPKPGELPGLFRQKLLATADLLVSLKEKHQTARGIAKAKLRDKIRAEEAILSRELNVRTGPNIVEWRVQFADVFVRNTGFDVVVANPPYVSALAFRRSRPAEEREAIRQEYSTTTGAWDLYIPFFERGLQLLRPGGLLAYISPNKYLSAEYAKSLRALVRREASLWQLVDLSQCPVFESADVYPVLTFLSQGSERQGEVICRLPPKSGPITSDPRFFRVVAIDRSALDLLPDRIWGFLLSDQLDLLKRLLPRTAALGRYADVSATTTAAEADEYGRRMKESRVAKADAFRVVNTGTIDRYSIRWGRDALKHQGKKLLQPVLAATDVSPKRARLYAAPKILFAKMAKRCEAFLDARGEYAALNANCAVSPRSGASLEYLCAYCNSSTFMFFYNQMFGALRMSGGYYQFQAPQLRAVPVPQASTQETARIGALAQQLAATLPEGCDTTRSAALSREIDLQIARLLGLTETEQQSMEEQTDWPERSSAIEVNQREIQEAALPFVRVRPPRTQRYVTCVPLVPLKAAAGAFGDPQRIDDSGFEWVEVKSTHRLRRGMFVAQVVGKSMEPAIPDGSYCLFVSPVEGTRQGKTVLVQLRDATDPETGERYTVKRYESDKTEQGDLWRHTTITLKPLNPDFKPIVLTPEDEGSVRVVAEFVDLIHEAHQ